MENTQNVTTTSRESLKTQALVQRIAQLVAQYEEQLADFRAQATMEIQALQERNNALAQENIDLSTRIESLTVDHFGEKSDESVEEV